LIYSITNYLNFLLTFILLYLLSTFSLSIYGFSWLPDILTRLNLNDALFNMYHFLWVTALYLSPFYFIVWALFLFFSFRYKALQYLSFFSFLYFLYIVEVLDFVMFNWQTITLNTTLLQFNTLLVNNLNKIHPFIFYSGTFLTFNFFIINILLKSTTVRFILPFQLKQLIKVSPITLLTSLTALFLGSWWAVQEGTWGGWWNWDPSETFGLLFLLLTLINLHTTFYIEDSSRLLKKIKTLIYILVLSYFFIQLNFDLVSHNFGVKFFYFFNNKLFFYVIILLTFFYFSWTFFKLTTCHLSHTLLKNLTLKSDITTRWIRNLVLLYIQWLILIVLLVSFFILFNYFIWNFVNFNLFNFDLDRNVANTIFLLFLGFWVYHFDLILILTVVLLCAVLNNFLFLFWYFLFRQGSFIVKLHQTLILFFLLNLLSINNSFILWSIYTFTEELLLGNNLLDTGLVTFTCDYIFIDKNVIYKTSLSNWFTSWNFFLYSNTPVANTFFLTFSNSALVNFYALFSFSNTSFILIENNFVSPLALLTVLISVYYLQNFLSCKLSYYY